MVWAIRSNLTTFLKIDRQEPSVRDMPRHKQEVIKLLITAKEPVKTYLKWGISKI